MLELHQRWLQGLDCVQYFVSQTFISDLDQDLLDHVVAVLVVDQLLDDEVYSGLDVGSVSKHAQAGNDLVVVLLVGALENLLDLWFVS